MASHIRPLGRASWFLSVAAGLCALCTAAPGAAARHEGGRAAYLVVGQRPGGATVVETLTARGRVLHVLGRAGPYWTGPAQWSLDHTGAVWLGPHGVTAAEMSGRRSRVLTPIAPSCRTNCISQSFDVSPDGKTVVVAGVGPHGRDLVAVSVATGQTRILARARGSTNLFIAGGWSPDGKSILYGRSFVHRNEAENDVVWIHADGKGARVVLRVRRPIEGPDVSWSPSGREIAFVDESGSKRNGHFSVGVLDLASSRIHSLPHHRPLPWAPAWAPSSQRLALSSEYERPGTITVAANGTRLRRFTFLGDWLVWTRAGLDMLRGPQNTTVYRSGNGVEPPRRLFTMPAGQSIFTFVPR